jgi:CHAD domain-containing protein
MEDSPPMPSPLELLLPPDIGAAEVAAAVEGRYTVVEGPAETDERVYMDSHDARLRAAGLVLERRGRELRLREPGHPDRVGEVPAGRGDRMLAEDLPDGPLRARIAGELETRAALPRARVRSRVQHLRVLNGDDKTVVRLLVESAETLDHGRPRPLRSRVGLRPVLGYDKAFERVRLALEQVLGLERARATLVDDAVAGSGGEPEGVSTKVVIPMEASQRADATMLAVCTRLATVAEATLPGTLEDLDTEFLHDFRVSIRRTRSMLRELPGVLPPEEEERAVEELRWVQAITGPTRDLDVQLEGWDEAVARLPTTASADLGPLHDLLVRRREQAFRRMRRDLRSDRFRSLWNDWRAVLDRPLPAEPEDERPNAARPIGEVTGERVRRVYGRMVKLGGRIDDDSPAEDLHKLRKRAKELRYLLEIYGDLWPQDEVKPIVSALKKLQDVLGRFQDRQVQAEFLRGLGPEVATGPGGPDALIALGLVIDRLAADQAAARAEFDERFSAFAAKPNRRRLTRLFR